MTGFGYTASTIDDRDFTLSDLINANKESGVNRVSLNHRHPARDQGDIDCCVSIAIVTAMEVLDSQYPPSRRLSPLYHYFKARGGSENLRGMGLGEGLLAAIKGVCPEVYHEKKIIGEGESTLKITRNMSLQEPTDEASRQAEQYRIGWDNREDDFAYYLLPGYNRVGAWRYALQKRKPIIIGFKVTEAYQSMIKKKDKQLIHDIDYGEILPIGHAAVVLGYVDSRSAFLVKDSRGSKVGENGRWWLPYEIAESRIVIEARVIGNVSYE